MPTANVETVLRGYDAFNRRDIDAIVESLHQDVAFKTTVETFYGRRGVAEWIRQADEAFTWFELTVAEIFEAGAYVVAVVHERAQGRDSGVEIDHHFTHAWRLEDGLVVELRAFTERAEALDALSLSE